MFSDKNVKMGRYFKNMFDEPLRLKPPVDRSNLKRIEAKLDFSINQFVYDQLSMKNQKK